jgi:hypothetical protein
MGVYMEPRLNPDKFILDFGYQFFELDVFGLPLVSDGLEFQFELHPEVSQVSEDDFDISEREGQGQLADLLARRTIHAIAPRRRPASRLLAIVVPEFVTVLHC